MNRRMAGVLTAFMLLTVLGTPVAAGPVVITITGIATVEGRVFVGLFRPGDDFPRQDRTYQGLTMNVDAPEMVARLADVPDGTYAVAVFHDADNNGEHDRNFFGIPKEDYGFSNNARGTFGPPAFEEAAFEHSLTTRITIDLNP